MPLLVRQSCNVLFLEPDGPSILKLSIAGNGNVKATWDSPGNNKPAVYRVFYEISTLAKTYTLYSFSTSAILGPCLPGTTCTVSVQSLGNHFNYPRIVGPVSLLVSGK